MQMSANDMAWSKGQNMWEPGADVLDVLDRAKEAGFEAADPRLMSFILGYNDASKIFS